MAILEAEPAEQDEEEGQEPESEFTDDMRAAALDLKRTFDRREQYARQSEVVACWKKRMMERGFADAVCSPNQANFQVSPAAGVGLSSTGIDSEAAVRPPVRRSYNVFLARERTWAAAFSQTPPGVRFEPEDPEEPQDIAAADAANTMRRVIEKFNPPKKLSQRAGRYCWTDGRVVALTEFLKNQQRFGLDEDGEPMGREVISLFGVLETKVPITCQSFHDYPYLKIEEELDQSIVKGLYPDVADLIEGLPTVSSDNQFARLARITSSQGDRGNKGGDADKFLSTRERWWLRPAAFNEIADKDLRKLFLKRYPEGCRWVYVGDVLCDERPECMDDHLAVMHALDGDGQSRPSVGSPMMDPQRVTNELLGLIEETFKYVIPMTLIDDQMLDADAIQEMQAAPGAFVPVARTPGDPLGDSVQETATATFPPEMMAMVEQLVGPLADKLSSTPPVLAGASMPDQTTAHGYALARDQALGVIGLTWQPYCEFYAEVMAQAVRIAGESRPNRRLKAMVATVSGGGRRNETVSLQIGDLKGNFLCFPESDANFPEGYTARSNKIMNLLNNAGQSPLMAPLLLQPDNQALIRDAIGVEGLVVPGADARNKQLTEIAEMESESPVPNPAFTQWQQAAQLAQQAGQPPQGAPPDPLVSSVPIDPDFDDNEAEAEECSRWLNSPAGQEAKRSKVQWFLNVRLHAMAHKQAVKDQAAQQAPKPKPPGESINFKDVAAADPGAATQMLEQAGLRPTPPPQAAA